MNLFESVQANDLGRVRELIEQGADVRSVDDDGLTPLHHAAHCGNIECVDLLVAAGASVNGYDGQPDTPLTIAVMANTPLAIETLIRAGADVNLAINNDADAGRTPLMYAAAYGFTAYSERRRPPIPTESGH